MSYFIMLRIKSYLCYKNANSNLGTSIKLSNSFATYMKGIPACKMLPKQLKGEFRKHAILRQNDVIQIAHIGQSSSFFYAKYTFCMHHKILQTCTQISNM